MNRLTTIFVLLLICGIAYAVQTGGPGVNAPQFVTYERAMVLSAASASVGVSAPTSESIVDSGGVVVGRGYGFDSSAGEAITNARCVPGDWDGISNMTLTIIWTNENGDALTDTQDVDWYARYRTVAVGEAFEAAAVTSVLGSYTQSDAGTDSENIHTDITLVYTDGTNPLVIGDCLAIEIQRNVGGTETNSYDSNAVILRTALKLNSIRLPLVN